MDEPRVVMNEKHSNSDPALKKQPEEGNVKPDVSKNAKVLFVKMFKFIFQIQNSQI